MGIGFALPVVVPGLVESDLREDQLENARRRVKFRAGEILLVKNQPTQLHSRSTISPFDPVGEMT